MTTDQTIPLPPVPTPVAHFHAKPVFEALHEIEQLMETAYNDQEFVVYRRLKLVRDLLNSSVGHSDALMGR